MIEGRPLIGNDPDLVPKLERLASDMRGYMEGRTPSQAELDDAPYLIGARPSATLQPCLVGQVFGHPLLAEGKITTSPLFAVSWDYSWGRTLNRLYRLKGFRP